MPSGLLIVTSCEFTDDNADAGHPRYADAVGVAADWVVPVAEGVAEADAPLSVSTPSRNFSVSAPAFPGRTVSRTSPPKNSTMPTVVAVAHTHAVPAIAVPLADVAVTPPQARSPPSRPTGPVRAVLAPRLNPPDTGAGLDRPRYPAYPERLTPS